MSFIRSKAELWGEGWDEGWAAINFRLGDNRRKSKVIDGKSKLTPKSVHWKLVRHPKSNKTGSSGNLAVMKKFVDIGWNPIAVPQEHDVGTDLLIIVSDNRLFDMGIVIGAQVKSGPSEFGNSTKGGWFHYTNSEHADYWTRHRCPHLMILFNTETEVAYWNHINLKTTKSTGKGFRIFVPKTQRIELGQLDALLEIATAKLTPNSHVGKAFDASVNSVTPQARIRTALLAPRLLAPHSNRGRVDVLESEEALALVTQVNVMELNLQIEDRSYWAALDEKPITKDWRWHFVHALWIALTQSDLTFLEASIKSATREDWRAAGLACLVSRYFEHSRLPDAKKLLDLEIARDKAEPTDHAWLLLHRSRTRAELGEIEEAIHDAELALTALAAKGEDVTAMLLFSVAMRTQFNLRSWRDHKPGELAKLINSGDNPASWWQSQQVSWALEDAAEDQFKVWARSTAQYLNNHPIENKLLAPKIMAGFAADHSAWRHAGMRHARYEIQRAKTSSSICYQLEQMLRAGTTKELKLAANRFFEDGPSDPIADLLKRCVPKNFTHSTWDSMVCLWSDFGEFGDEQSADAVIHWALAQFEPEAQLKKLNLDAKTSHGKLMDLMEGALPCASDKSHLEVTDFLLGDKPSSVIVQRTRARMLFAVRSQVLTPTHDAKLLGLLSFPLDASFKSSVMRTALKRGLMEAKVMAASAISEGDWYLYSRIFDQITLEPETLAPLIEAVSAELKSYRFDASNGKYSTGNSVDQAALLTRINLKYPNSADWRPLVDFLLDTSVNADEKSAACMQIAKSAKRIPAGFAGELVKGCPKLVESKYLPKDWFGPDKAREPATDLANLIHCSLGGIAENELISTLATLIAANGKYLIRALQLIYLKPKTEYEFVVLLSLRDSNFAVRVNAASTLGRYASINTLTPALGLAVSSVVKHRGVQIPMAFLNSLDNELNHVLLESIVLLTAHPSCRIRARAQELIPMLLEGRRRSQNLEEFNK